MPRTKTTRTTPKPPDPVTQYAEDVVSGKEVAGPLVRLAAERHLRDLVDGPKRGLTFSIDAANRVFGYFHDVLRLVNDEGLPVPFKLHASQHFIIGSLFGWLGRDGYRRFRVAYIEQGKGNGKALAIDTPIPTPNALVTMDKLSVGDSVLDEFGQPTTVMAVTEIMTGHECYAVQFEGSRLIADADHLWRIADGSLLTTKQIAHGFKVATSLSEIHKEVVPESFRTIKLINHHEIVACTPTETVPVRCITVSNPTGMYLAGLDRIPTHNSPLAGGIGLYMLTGDGEVQAQVFAAAVDRDQAKVPFQFAVSMVDRSELLTNAITKSGGKFGDVTRVHNMFHRKSGSYFRPLSSDSSGRGKSGFLPHCVILDELHEHPTDAMVEFVRANTKGRKQPLVVMITNSGVFDNTSVAWRYHEYTERLLTGMGEPDDEFFGYICALDKTDDWMDRRCWKKANPLLGISIPERYLEQQVREAVGMPSKQSIVRRLNFCEWVESADPVIAPEVWRENGGVVHADALAGRRCYGGLDLSQKNDLTSLTLVFEPDARGVKDVLCFFWTPKDNLREREERDRAHYQLWVRDKYLIAKDGPTIDYEWVALKIGELTSKYQIKAIAFDPYKIEYMEKELDAAGVTVNLIKHGQGFRDMTPAVEAFEDACLNRQLRHGNNPVLTWNVANCRVAKDPAGNRKFDKRKATGRIDGVVTLAMACNLWTGAKAAPAEPQYQAFFV